MRYLGSPIGVHVFIATKTEYLLGKVRKRVWHWANRLLSMQGRIVLVRHVLRAIPVFHLMSLALNHDGFKSLESIYHEFVWGLGDPKVPLVAWDTITQSFAVGGLSITSFKEHATLLKL